MQHKARFSGLRRKTKNQINESLGDSLVDVLPEPRLPRIRGTRSVIAVLPSGRTVGLRFPAALVPSREIDQLRRAVNMKSMRRLLEMRRDSNAIKQLSRLITKDSSRLSKSRLRRERKLDKRLEKGDLKLAARLSSEQGRARREFKEEWKDIRTTFRTVRHRDLWDQIVIISTLPLLAAYSQRGLCSEHNLTITFVLALWLFGDDLTDFLSGESRSRSRRLRDLNIWSYLAPAGNLLTGWWLLDKLQHERFITGVADLNAFEMIDWRHQRRPRFLAANIADAPARVDAEAPGDESGESASPTATEEGGGCDEKGKYECVFVYRTRVELESHLAPEYVADFESFASPVALATVQSVTFEDILPRLARTVRTVQAEVRRGILTITVTVSGVPLKAMRVAWLIDTREPSS